jgi:hypothetical protein
VEKAITTTIHSLVPLVVVVPKQSEHEKRPNERYELKKGAFITVLSSTRDYPEDPDRVEVQVPSWESLCKCEDSDTQEEEVRERCEIQTQARIFVKNVK